MQCDDQKFTASRRVKYTGNKSFVILRTLTPLRTAFLLHHAPQIISVGVFTESLELQDFPFDVSDAETKGVNI